MSVFLIDYENVRTGAFGGLEDLTEGDRVIVFYTNNSDNLTFSLMQRLANAKAQIDYLKVACGGKNSLDFQLCSYLGFLIGTMHDTRFCIISRDKGFSTMLSLWGENTENNNSVICCTNIYNGNVRRPIEESEVFDSSAQEDTEAAELHDPSAPLEAENVIEEPASIENEPAAAAQVEPETPLEPKAEPEKPEEKAEEKNEEKPEEKAEEQKPKRPYKRRTYNRKPKTPAAEQTA